MMIGGVLLWLTLAAQAADPAACLAGVTVTSDHLEVRVERGQTVQHRTWSVQVDAPQHCADGIPAPVELEGSRDGQAVIRGDRLLIPIDAPPGATYTLQRTDAAGSPHTSGVYDHRLPGLTVQHAQVDLHAVAASRLAVATDDRAQLEEADVRGRKVRITWPEGTDEAQVAWSTWASWDEATASLAREAGRRLNSRAALGAAFSQAPDLQAYQALPPDQQLVAALVEEAARQVRVAPGAWGRFEGSRTAAEVARSGEGTAAERALVLLSTLRDAGLDARAALVRPASLGRLPSALPSPEAFPRPAVVVHGSQGQTDALGQHPPIDAAWWIDPAAPPTDPALLPAAFRGAQGLVAGDLPQLLDDRHAPDGLVLIHTELLLDADGGAILSSQLRAEDAAIGAIRAWLAPLSPLARQDAWQQIVRAGRPQVDSLRVRTSGIDDPSRAPQVRLTLRLAEPFRHYGKGFAGPVPPLLAPGLASVLPPQLEVREVIELRAPEGHRVALATGLEDLHEGAIHLLRSTHTQGDTRRLETSALLDQRDLAPREERRERARLLAQGANGPWIAVLPEGASSGPLIRPLARALGAEPAVLSAILEPGKAGQALKGPSTRGELGRLVAQLERLAPSGEARPWRALFGAVPEAERFLVLEAMERVGLARDAWQLSGHLTRSEDPVVAVRAMVAIARLQGRQPDAQKDAEARRAWVAPVKLLQTAHNRALALAAEGTDGLLDEVRVPLAFHLTLDDQASEAQALIQAVLQRRADPEASAVGWMVEAALGSAELSAVEALAAAHADNPRVLTPLSHAARSLQAHDLGARLALDAARLRHGSAEAWMWATDSASAAGDLPTALYAARRASDRDPVAYDTGVTLQILASLAGDAEVAALATERSGYQALIDTLPAPFESIWAITQPQHELAVLRHYDRAVVTDPERLARRAELLTDTGRVDEAARDGWLLAQRHRRSDAITHLHAASTQLWSTHPSALLDRLTRHAPVRAARMELALISGRGNPLTDAYALGYRHESARVLLLAARNHSALFEESGWSPGIPPTGEAPPGFSTNRLLTLDGVSAWSDPSAGHTLMMTAAGKPLPPPLSLLLAPGPVLERSEGATLQRFLGAGAPIYVRTLEQGSTQYFGIGFSAAGARQALESVQED